MRNEVQPVGRGERPEKEPKLSLCKLETTPLLDRDGPGNSVASDVLPLLSGREQPILSSNFRDSFLHDLLHDLRFPHDLLQALCFF